MCSSKVGLGDAKFDEILMFELQFDRGGLLFHSDLRMRRSCYWNVLPGKYDDIRGVGDGGEGGGWRKKAL